MTGADAQGDPGGAPEDGRGGGRGAENGTGADAMSTSGPAQGALARADFPWARVSELLGIDSSTAEVALRDAERSQEAVREASRAFLDADDDRRAGRVPSTPIAVHPDFPTGVAMSLVGAGVLWGETAFIPAIAVRAAKDHYADGNDALAASFIALVAETALPGRDDPAAWAAQSLLVAVLQRSGSPADAEALARDLAAHAVPLDLWRDDDPTLPDDALAWHGGALVEGLGPRRDSTALTVEGAEDYLQALMRDMLREDEAEADGDA